MSRTTPITYRMLDAFFRHAWLFLIAVIVVSGITMTALYLRSLTFRATALTQVNPEDVASDLGMSQNTSWESPAQQNVDRLNDLLYDDQKGGFLDIALNDTKAADGAPTLDQPINLDPAAQDARLAQLRRGLSVTAQSNNTYAIGLTWDKSDEAARIVQAFQDQYIKEVGLERGAKSTATGSFLDSEIADYKGRMLKAEQTLIDYRSHNSGELPEAQSADISQLSSLQAQLDDMRISQHDAEMKRQALLTRIAQVPPQTITEQTATESPLQTQIKEMRAKRDAMLLDKTPIHPDVVALSEQIEALQQQQQDKARSGAPEAKGAVQTKTAADPEYQALQSELMDANIAQTSQQAHTKLLQAEIAQYLARVQHIPAAQKELTEKTRDYSLFKDEYDALVKRRLDVNMQGKLDSVEATSTLQPLGRVSVEPTTGKTKKALMLAGSLLLGLIVGVITVVLSEWSDRSLRYVSDAQRLLGVPVLGTVPETRVLAAPRLVASKGRPTLTAPDGRA